MKSYLFSPLLLLLNYHLLFLFCISSPQKINCLDNGLGLTPPMGWNSWHSFGCEVNETHILSIIDFFISSNLSSYGYNYIILDDCWQGSRSENGTLVPDISKFPNGIKYLSDYAHKNGLLFGIYSDAGFKSCSGLPGSLGYEDIDAKTFAEWEIDYLKYDNCFNDGSSEQERFTTMKDALMKQERKIFFAIDEWGISSPAEWAKNVGNSWRTGGDIEPTFESIMKNIDENEKWGGGKYEGRGGWNDPDVLLFGNTVLPYESRTQFGLWAISKAPLIIGNDVTLLNDDLLNLYKNEEVIAINKDSLGIQAKKLKAEQPQPEEQNYINGMCGLIIDECKGLDQQKFFINKDDLTIRSGDNFNCVQVPLCSEESIQITTSVCDLGASLCHWRADQKWTIRNDGTIHSNLNPSMCLTIGQDNKKVIIDYCYVEGNNNLNNKWEYNEKKGEIKIIKGNKCLTKSLGQENLEVWSGPLQDGGKVVMLLNRGWNKDLVRVKWEDIGLKNREKALVRDLWQKKDLGVFDSVFEAYCYDHSTYLLKITSLDKNGL